MRKSSNATVLVDGFAGTVCASSGFDALMLSFVIGVFDDNPDLKRSSSAEVCAVSFGSGSLLAGGTDEAMLPDA